MTWEPKRFKRLARSFFLQSPAVVAHDLIGHGLVRRIGGEWVGGVIVETEAYLSADDPASHSRSGLTRRCRSMFEIGGTLYVYTIHAKYCMNIATETKGLGSAVLIRAIEPVWGVEVMMQNRGYDDLRRLARGPAMLCQSLAITTADDGIDLVSAENFSLFRMPAFRTAATERLIGAGPRIGISSGKEMPLRFYERGNRFVSGPVSRH
jgi:DNA-3-methyladenine glycosylase